jgi:hypothetical protein
MIKFKHIHAAVAAHTSLARAKPLRANGDKIDLSKTLLRRAPTSLGKRNFKATE